MKANKLEDTYSWPVLTFFNKVMSSTINFETDPKIICKEFNESLLLTSVFAGMICIMADITAIFVVANRLHPAIDYDHLIVLDKVEVHHFPITYWNTDWYSLKKSQSVIHPGPWLKKRAAFSGSCLSRVEHLLNWRLFPRQRLRMIWLHTCEMQAHCLCINCGLFKGHRDVFNNIVLRSRKGSSNVKIAEMQLGTTIRCDENGMLTSQ